MFPSRHTAKAARAIGTFGAAAALSIGIADTALACSISDFSAAAVCDAGGNGVIRVTDRDASGTPATVSLYVQLSMPGGERLVDTKTIEHPTAQGVSVDLTPLNWYSGMTFRVHVKAGDQVDNDIQPLTVIPDETCAPSAPSSSAPATSPAHPSSASSATPTALPSPVQSSSAAAVPGASNAPTPAGGSTDLAETGAGSGTTVIAGAAAALVVTGGGIVVALRRRAAHRS
ncbi:LAETG motif-containing sortase-dependent surface protein [Streptomyces sp. NPDC051453]|uniref:LAETG motif-containing sortase-dependent surface protein n=1 Tax=Streptomyces sp. NPDC051453 TaxID=3154941 RepID=UPI00344177FA